MKLLRRSTAPVLACALCPFFIITAAYADLRVCNKTTSRVGIAIGYKGDHDWVSEGWWTIEAESCATVLAGPLVGRFYYIYAVDYDQGGEWSGRTAFFCTQEKEFTIQGVNDCIARGYQRTGFYEVENDYQGSRTIELTDQLADSTTQGVGGR